ncbi:MAG: alpha/beta hydrolase [Firmicutes bacterium]|nr:alpha/beta hydrolase [Bacillota bacterium]
MSVYSMIDQQPMLLRFLFYPRKWNLPAPAGAADLMVPVEDGIAVGCRLYESEAGRPWILLFHGNGEIAADYDQIAPLYGQKRVNLVVADYRGYGSSGGRPTFTGMVADAPLIYEAIAGRLDERGLQEKLFVMGRSLGSISALELAVQYAGVIPGLIIESGFISVVGLIEHLGLPSMGLDLSSIDRESRSKAAQIEAPVLIIHGRADSLVPFSQAEELHRCLGSQSKQLVPIPGAEHNDVIFVDRERYFGAIAAFVEEPERFSGGA